MVYLIIYYRNLTNSLTSTDSAVFWYTVVIIHIQFQVSMFTKKSFAPSDEKDIGKLSLKIDLGFLTTVSRHRNAPP